MRLRDLLSYEKITLQCHDNPDADALGAAFGLYLYFKSKNADVNIIYGGRNEIQKSNLKLLVEKFRIPVIFCAERDLHFKGLLITVDCQDGEGNVTHFDSDIRGIIDHHQSDFTHNGNKELIDIRPELGSCSTLVWDLLNQEGFDANENIKLSTCLYYGLMTDTGNFVEARHPLDRDMMESLKYDKAFVNQLINSNISLKELEVAGIALIRHVYNRDNRFAMIHAKPCDPNILGLIADFLLQVDVVDTCVVFNETLDGYKLSTRSCIREARADELIEYLTKDIGDGGGHLDKAGGFISKHKYEKLYRDMDIDSYVGMRMNKYFSSYDIVDTADFDINKEGFEKYARRSVTMGMVDLSMIWENGTPVTVRTRAGDVNTRIDGNSFVILDSSGKAYSINREKFLKSYRILNSTYKNDTDYIPTIRNRMTGEMRGLEKFIKPCRSMQQSIVLAKQLDRTVKLFTRWDENGYSIGNKGDYLVARIEDTTDISIVSTGVFKKNYEKI
ncbi:MAG: DHH family phosphoesterase [Lachnospiraceae bacterium]|nr:DHH family phosphoesterase [Lachnospiraceae bacterium]